MFDDWNLLVLIGDLAMQNKHIYIFSNLRKPRRKGLPRLNPRNINGRPSMPFQLEVWTRGYCILFSHKKIKYSSIFTVCGWS